MQEILYQAYQAAIKSHESDTEVRRKLVDDMISLFRKTNLFVICATGIIAIIEYILIYFNVIAPHDRIITENVILAFIGATVVQLGAIMVVIFKYLFPSSSS